jgi:hypothetical protein
VNVDLLLVRRMKRTMLVLVALACCLATAPALAAPPVITFPTPSGPGAQLPFTNNDSALSYGFVKSSNGWNFDGFQGTAPGNSLLRFVPTLQGPGALTPMGESSDWAFHMEFTHTGTYGANDTLMSAKAEPGFAGTVPGSPREQRIFAVDYTTAGTYNLKVGDLTGNGWVNVATGLVLDAYVDVDVHYRASPGILDLYWDGALVATAATGHGRYDADLFQVEEIVGAGSTSVRNFRLGHIEAAVPEPTSLLLVTLGAVGALILSRRR